MPDTATLLINCPDQKGLIARVAKLLYEHGGNILHADSHHDHQAALFFMRLEWDLDGFAFESFKVRFGTLATELDMTWRLERRFQDGTALPRMAVFVSQYMHCLLDLLQRWQAGEFACNIPAIVSNHETARKAAGFYGIPFHYFPVTPATKAQVEAEQRSLLEQQGVNLIALARYMQVLSAPFVADFPSRVINVHHSFLPAFVGAKPYHQAFERGVKLIGATSHYVNEQLDDGPIIEQDVMRVSHRDQLPDLIEKGRDLERIVLSRAVRWHLDHRILRYGNKTVVFD